MVAVLMIVGVVVLRMGMVVSAVVIVHNDGVFHAKGCGWVRLNNIYFKYSLTMPLTTEQLGRTTSKTTYVSTARI